MKTPATKGFIESIYSVFKGYRVPAKHRFNAQRAGEYLNGKIDDEKLTRELAAVFEPKILTAEDFATEEETAAIRQKQLKQFEAMTERIREKNKCRKHTAITVQLPDGETITRHDPEGFRFTLDNSGDHLAILCWKPADYQPEFFVNNNTGDSHKPSQPPAKQKKGKEHNRDQRQ